MSAKAEKKPAVLVVGPVPPTRVGGIASYIGVMLQSPLLNDNFNLICLDNSLSPWLRAGRLRRLCGGLLLCGRLVRLLLAERPALVHIHTSANMSFWEKAVMLCICRWFRRPAILHCHGADFDSFYRSSRLKPLIRMAFDQADVLVVLTRYWQDFFRALTRSRIELIPNCAAAEFFSRPVAGGKGEAVVFVGEVGPRKGLDVFLEAVELLRLRGIDNPLLVAGADSGDGALERYRRRVADKGLGRVEFLGNQQPHELLELFSRAALFTLPSFAEGLAIALLEAMAAGLPVVVTPAGGAEDVVRDGVNGLLVPVGDCRKLADALERLLADPGLRLSMGESNRTLAEQKYHPRVTALALDRLYRSLIGRNPVEP